MLINELLPQVNLPYTFSSCNLTPIFYLTGLDRFTS